jgi:hypothetical protein
MLGPLLPLAADSVQTNATVSKKKDGNRIFHLSRPIFERRICSKKARFSVLTPSKHNTHNTQYGSAARY